MNQPDHPDDFERWLQRATPSPPPADWKAGILASAHPRDVTIRTPPIAPRWLLGSWGLAWVAAFALWIGTPSPDRDTAPTPVAPDVSEALKQRQEMLASLLAANTR